MGEPKPIASLSGMLLARKGAARPAMRRPASFGNAEEAATHNDDLGWNDMGYDVDPAPNAPMDHNHTPSRNPLAGAVPEARPEVRQQQEMIAQRLQAQAEVGFDSLPAESKPAVEDADVVEPEAGADGAKQPADVVEAVTAPKPQPAVIPAIPKSVAAQVSKPVKRAAAGSGEKAAFTLRLDKERHLKLRLACAVSNRSAQNLVTDALDALLEKMPEIGQLAARVPSKQ